MNNRVGQQLGNYRITRLLGQGGFADVYLGEHIYLKTRAAIKVLQMHLTQNNQQRFLTEARIIARLQHPHIVPVLEFDVVDETPYLVMDYAPHGTLRQRYPKGTRLAAGSILSYIKHIAVALDYVHNENLIHRDIKPENMLLGRNDEALLSDFGIARAAQELDSPLQNRQKIVGTIAYMAPEQIQDQPCPASDQYALGVVIYEWLCGEHPFQGSFTEVATQHALVPPPSLCEKVPEISPVVEEVVMIALAKDPQQRFGSVQAFANALERACQGEVLISRTSSTVSPLSIPSVTAQSLPEHKHRISRRSVLAGLAGLALASCGSIAWVSFSRRSQAPPTLRNTSPTVTALPLGTTLYTYHGHASGVVAVAWSPKEQRIASGGGDDTIQIWDATTGNHSYIYKGRFQSTFIVDTVTWSPDGKRIASSSDNVQIWNPATGQLVLTYNGSAPIAWSPDGKRLASAGGKFPVEVWDAITGHTLLSYRSLASTVNALAWSPDGNLIAFGGGEPLGTEGGGDYTIQVWNATTGRHVYAYHGHAAPVNALVWAPDGQRIASADGASDSQVSQVHVVRVWNATTRSRAVIYHGHTAQVNAVVWSPDGKRIASASDDKTVQIWDPTTGHTIFIYRGHFGPVRALAWSPDGRMIASGSFDGTLQVWKVV